MSLNADGSSRTRQRPHVVIDDDHRVAAAQEAVQLRHQPIDNGGVSIASAIGYFADTCAIVQSSNRPPIHDFSSSSTETDRARRIRRRRTRV